MKNVRVEGLSAVNAALGELPKRLGKPVLTRVGKRRLVPMRDAAKANAPVEEGELRDAIIISARQKTGSAKRRFDEKSTVEVMMGPNDEVGQKAVPQEFGSINNPPAGFMRKAWDEHADGLLDGIAEDLGREVAATAKRYSARQARKGG